MCRRQVGQDLCNDQDACQPGVTEYHNLAICSNVQPHNLKGYSPSKKYHLYVDFNVAVVVEWMPLGPLLA